MGALNLVVSFIFIGIVDFETAWHESLSSIHCCFGDPPTINGVNSI